MERQDRRWPLCSMHILDQRSWLCGKAKLPRLEGYRQLQGRDCPQFFLAGNRVSCDNWLSKPRANHLKYRCQGQEGCSGGYGRHWNPAFSGGWPASGFDNRLSTNPEYVSTHETAEDQCRGAEQQQAHLSTVSARNIDFWAQAHRLT